MSEEKTKEVEPTPEELAEKEREIKLKAILWTRKPPLTEQEINSIIEESKRRPLSEVLMKYSFLTDSDKIVSEFKGETKPAELPTYRNPEPSGESVEYDGSGRLVAMSKKYLEEQRKAAEAAGKTK